MSAPVAKVGDMLTLVARIRKVYGPGPRVAIVDTIGGLVSVPLTVDGQLPDPAVTITPADPAPSVFEHPGRCDRCGR